MPHFNGKPTKIKVVKKNVVLPKVHVNHQKIIETDATKKKKLNTKKIFAND